MGVALVCALGCAYDACAWTCVGVWCVGVGLSCVGQMVCVEPGLVRPPYDTVAPGGHTALEQTIQFA